MRSLSLFLLLLGTLSACQSRVIDNTMIVDPPSAVSYADDIQPIFSRSCSGNGCHINETESGVNLTTYRQVINSVGAGYGSRVVVPGDADGSPLVDKLGLRPSRGSRMPLGTGPLSGTEIALIKAWIDDGAQDN